MSKPDIFQDIKLKNGKVLKVVRQKPYQKTVEVEGQSVALPFTNGNCLIILLKQLDGKWGYFDRRFSNDQIFPDLLKSYEKSFNKEEEKE